MPDARRATKAFPERRGVDGAESPPPPMGWFVSCTPSASPAPRSRSPRRAAWLVVVRGAASHPSPSAHHSAARGALRWESQVETHIPIGVIRLRIEREEGRRRAGRPRGRGVTSTGKAPRQAADAGQHGARRVPNKRAGETHLGRDWRGRDEPARERESSGWPSRAAAFDGTTRKICEPSKDTIKRCEETIALQHNDGVYKCANVNRMTMRTPGPNGRVRTVAKAHRRPGDAGRRPQLPEKKPYLNSGNCNRKCTASCAHAGAPQPLSVKLTLGMN